MSELGSRALSARVNRIAAAGALLALLAACAGAGVNPRVPPAGASAEFTSAYSQGCNSGFKDADWDGWEASYFKDVQLYARDADYKTGWDQGYNACLQYGVAHPRPESRGGASVGI